MKITNVRTHIVNGLLAPWILVSVETDAGITGIGDATNFPGGLIVEKAVNELGYVIEGEDPFNIEALWSKMYRSLYYLGIGGPVTAAISGIEIALWDIVGKACGMPIYKLLGGSCHDSLRLYANLWFWQVPPTPDDYAAKAKEVVASGYTALKFDPFLTDRVNRTITSEEERLGIARLSAVREAVGPDIDILVETHGSFDVRTVLRLAELAQPFHPFWLEEPVPPENVDAMAKVNQKCSIPIATGERLFTRHGFRQILEKQAADILMPDVVRTGGIMETKKIAAMADTYYVTVAPHNPNSPIATLASAHTMQTVTNFLILEFLYVDAPWRDAILSHPLEVHDGHLYLSDRPGLGVEINWDVVDKHRYTRDTSSRRKLLNSDSFAADSTLGGEKIS